MFVVFVTNTIFVVMYWYHLSRVTGQNIHQLCIAVLLKITKMWAVFESRIGES